jgi:hypothetical protein
VDIGADGGLPGAPIILLMIRDMQSVIDFGSARLQPPIGVIRLERPFKRLLVFCLFDPVGWITSTAQTPDTEDVSFSAASGRGEDEQNCESY